MSDLISREALKKALEEYKYCGFYDKAIEIIDNTPTVSDRYDEGYAQGYIDGATNNPKECKACDYYKFAQSFINGIVEVISKNGLTSIDELLEILKREANKSE